jgi:hypothetical protein
VNAILLPRFYSVDLASKIDFLTNRQNMIELQITHILFHIQVIAYFVAIFLLLRKAKNIYLENNAELISIPTIGCFSLQWY